MIRFILLMLLASNVYSQSSEISAGWPPRPWYDPWAEVHGDGEVTTYDENYKIEEDEITERVLFSSEGEVCTIVDNIVFCEGDD